METYWWVALAVLVLLALVVSVVDGRGRLGPRRKDRGRGARRPGGSVRPPGGPGGPAAPKPGRKAGKGGRGRPPEPGEIWWADVPYEDGPGSKDRPCLVLSVRGGSAVVAKITSKHHEERPGVIALPAGTVGDAHGRHSFLETDELRDVALGAFRRRVGVLDPAVWERVRES